MSLLPDPQVTPVSSEAINGLGIIVDLSGILVIILGFYWLMRGLFLFSAAKRKDTYFLKEYGSKNYPPFFFVVLGTTLMVSGFIVVFVPFATDVAN